MRTVANFSGILRYETSRFEKIVIKRTHIRSACYPPGKDKNSERDFVLSFDALIRSLHAFGFQSPPHSSIPVDDAGGALTTRNLPTDGTQSTIYFDFRNISH